MPVRRRLKWWLAALIVLALAATAAPWLLRSYWASRSSNPIRRGLERARRLGCFSCHGELGRSGIPDPGAPDRDVPNWDSLARVRYVKTAQDVRDYILRGSVPSTSTPALEMPAYADMLDGTDLEDLVAAFMALSGMTAPPPNSPAARGEALAREWRCLECHGAAGSGGLPNPGSLAGFVPGWYGADFKDLVRDREEFEEWIRLGTPSRFEHSTVAGYFIRRQRLFMPSYEAIEPSGIDDLWAYAQWLERTGGGSADVTGQ